MHTIPIRHSPQPAAGIWLGAWSTLAWSFHPSRHVRVSFTAFHYYRCYLQQLDFDKYTIQRVGLSSGINSSMIRCML
jgi:hypothetical protein